MCTPCCYEAGSQGVCVESWTGPKKSRAKRQSGAEIKHVATAKLLAEQKAKPPNTKK